jgi:CheY-like chemotaxis protein
MVQSPLDGCSILLVEDEPLIVMDIQLALDGSGAKFQVANCVKDAIDLVKQDGLSLGIFDQDWRTARALSSTRYFASAACRSSSTRATTFPRTNVSEASSSPNPRQRSTFGR